MLRTNSETVEKIKEYEGLRLHPYYCQAGVLTIGYGHTSDKYYRVRPGVKITESFAEEVLIHDIGEAEQIVLEQVRVPLNRNQFSALVSFVFNRGSLKYYNSAKKRSVDTTLLRLLNAGNYQAAADQLPRWVHARHPHTGRLRKLEGLVRRRKWEREMFMRPTTEEVAELAEPKAMQKIDDSPISKEEV